MRSFTLKIFSLILQIGLSSQTYVVPSSTLPPTPHLPSPRETGYVNLTHVDIWYAQFGPCLNDSLANKIPPIVFLHGGFANSDYFGHQISSLLARQSRQGNPHEDATIIAIDSRLQGRSTGLRTQPITYDLMREDVVGVLDHFGIPAATFVGWSDGGIIGLDLALNAPHRVHRLFAFAASYNPDNIFPTINDAPVWKEYTVRAKKEYKRLAPDPDYKLLSKKINRMFATLPNYDAKDMGRIPTLYDNCHTSPLIWIVDAANEEAIKLYTPRKLHQWIEGSGLLILPSVSHFAFLQDPKTFNAAIERFLDTKIDCSG